MIEFKDIDSLIGTIFDIGSEIEDWDENDVFGFDYNRASFFLLEINGDGKSFIEFNYEIDKPIAYQLSAYAITEFFTRELNRVLSDILSRDDTLDIVDATHVVFDVVNVDTVTFTILS